MTFLTPQQQAAVDAPADMHVVLEAVPGAGKTTVIRERINKLISENKISPANIVVATFSRSQAEDMARRIFEVYPSWRGTELGTGFGGAGQITTLHAMARRMVVNYFDEYRKRGIVPPYKERKIIETIVEELKWTKNKKPVGWQSILFWINYYKSRIDPNETLLRWDQNDIQRWAEVHHESYDALMLSKTAIKYQKELDKANMWSFADLLRTCEIKMQEDQLFREYWSNQFTHVLVDEGQDTNAQCMRILFHLAPKALFIVGDSDQAIFGFMGATPEENLRSGFDRRYGKNSQRHLMTRNFRSHGTILDRANKLIEHNYGEDNVQFKKVIQPRESITGPDIDFAWFGDPKEEARAVVGEIAQRIEAKEVQPGNLMIMGRLRAMNANIEIELLRRRLPFVNLGNTSFFDQGIPKIVVAHFKLLLDPSDLTSFKEVYNIASCNMQSKGEYSATRWLGAAFLDLIRGESDLIEAAIEHQYDKDERGWARWTSGVNDLKETFEALQEFKPSSNALSALQMLNKLVLDRWIEDQYGVEETADSVREDLAIMADVIGDFSIEQFIQYTDQLKEVKGVKPEDLKDYILIGTIYRFKGLEREIGYVIGMSDGLLPHAFSIGTRKPKTDGLPVPNLTTVWDERNVCFVAITRAKNECHCSGVETWPTTKDTLFPSRFVYEMAVVKKEDYEVELESEVEAEVNVHDVYES